MYCLKDAFLPQKLMDKLAVVVNHGAWRQAGWREATASGAHYAHHAPCAPLFSLLYS